MVERKEVFRTVIDGKFWLQPSFPNYFLPGYLERKISAFVDQYNNHRYHESLANLTPADVYIDRGAKILKKREEIKKQTIRKRQLLHHAAAAETQTETEPEPQ